MSFVFNSIVLTHIYLYGIKKFVIKYEFMNVSKHQKRQSVLFREVIWKTCTCICLNLERFGWNRKHWRARIHIQNILTCLILMLAFTHRTNTHTHKLNTQNSNNKIWFSAKKRKRKMYGIQNITHSPERHNISIFVIKRTNRKQNKEKTQMKINI